MCQHVYHHRPSNSTDFGVDFFTAGSTGVRAALPHRVRIGKAFL